MNCSMASSYTLSQIFNTPVLPPMHITQPTILPPRKKYYNKLKLNSVEEIRNKLTDDEGRGGWLPEPIWAGRNGGECPGSCVPAVFSDKPGIQLDPLSGCEGIPIWLKSIPTCEFPPW